VLGIIVVSLIAIQLYKNRFFLMIFQLLMTVLSAGLFERAYQTLGIERGFVFGDCNMESGLPAWFALDKWIPTVFEVKAACGYTPEILFGITMAEVLIVLSVFLLLISVILLLVQIKKFYFSTDI
jgi:disulfide bond formation protein DsbB